jgi:hypothetical protein
MLRKLKWQLPGESLAARYNWCQGPVPGRSPAVEKHWSIAEELRITDSNIRMYKYRVKLRHYLETCLRTEPRHCSTNEVTNWIEQYGWCSLFRVDSTVRQFVRKRDLQSINKFKPDWPRPTTLLPPRSNGKPEAATTVYKLLMMGKRMPETCWAVFERRTINLRDWCNWLVDLFECMMMHGLTTPNFINKCL